MQIVEEGSSDVGIRAPHHRGAIESIEEIDSDDNDSDISRAVMAPTPNFRHLLKGFDGDRNADNDDHWSQPLLDGPSLMDYPVDNNQDNWLHLPSIDIRARPEMKKGKK